MADAPRLNSATDATASRYAPLSWVAVVSLVVGVVFVLVLLGVAILAWLSGQMVLEWWLFAFPAAGLALAFIARRQILNSEGARTGLGYASAGWWLCVVFGGCYLAYWLATDWGVSSDAERQMTTWVEKLRKGNPNDPNDPAVREAYLMTLEPGQAGAFKNNPMVRQAPEFAMPLGVLRDSPLLLVSARNPDPATTKLVPQGLRGWKVTPDGKVECEVAAALQCPEGVFPVKVPMEAVTDKDTKVRVWRVAPAAVLPEKTYCDPQQATRTRYGWLIAHLDRQAQMLCEQFVDTVRVYPPQFGQSVAVDAFVAGRTSPPFAYELLKQTTFEARLALVGGSMLAGGGSTDPGDTFFARTDGKPMTNDPYDRPDGFKGEGGLDALRGVWADATACGLTPSWRSKFTPEQALVRNTVIDLSDPARVLLKVPVEFRPRSQEFQEKPAAFTSGKLVFVLDDAAVLKELADARAAAAGEKATREPPAELGQRWFPLRAVRLESDLVPVVSPKLQPPSGGPAAPPQPRALPGR